MKGHRKLTKAKTAIAVGLGLAVLLFSTRPAPALPDPAVASSKACEFFSIPQRYNTQAEGDVVVIGAQSGRRYRVIVASQSLETLSVIRACVTDAFITRSTLGPYIHVGSFEKRSDAETIRRILTRSGYRARTVYAR